MEDGERDVDMHMCIVRKRRWWREWLNWKRSCGGSPACRSEEIERLREREERDENEKCLYAAYMYKVEEAMVARVAKLEKELQRVSSLQK